jgi:hypothetical protein
MKSISRANQRHSFKFCRPWSARWSIIKDFVQIAQAENRADQCTHECNVFALTQVIESKQKRGGALTKLLEIPGMDGDQKSRILEKVMELMGEIEKDKKGLQEVHKTKD